MIDKDDEIRVAGSENLARLVSNLHRSEGTLRHLFDMGLAPATIRKFRLGVKEPYRRRGDGRVAAGALCFPLLSKEAEPLGRYACLNVPGMTENPSDEMGWTPGTPTTYYSAAVAGRSFVFVADTFYELWVLDQHFAGSVLENNFILITSSHSDRIPDEWRSSEFWSRWEAVYFGNEADDEGERRARELARLCGSRARRARVPAGAGRDWVDFFLRGNTIKEFLELVRDAPTMHDPAHTAEAPPDVGEFAVSPVNINNAFANGHLYYPFTVERREVEKIERRGGVSDSRMVTSYVTKVLRSDGAVLDVITLAAPRGTPRERWVLALTDGTRVEREPRPSHYATWRLDSLQKYIRARQEGRSPSHRPLVKILADVAAYLRRSVWLPFEEDYTLLALYVALSFVYQVFDAVPLLLVCGEKGTGKSELGDALARVSCNATVVGQGSAAGVVRLLNEARGLVVLDDLESVGRSLREASFGDISQMLKLGYKKGTGRKAITDKTGKTVVFDFYGPKVINNTLGVDPVLGSRVIHVRTRRIPDTVSVDGAFTGGDPDELARLRDELHVWGMADAHLVRERYTRLSAGRGDRRKEISAPLRAIAELSDDATCASLELVLGRQHASRQRLETPAKLLKEAAENCVRQGATVKLSAAQLSLELALLADRSYFERPAEAPWRKPEWVGHQLRSLRIRDAGLKVGRVRLYGVITRVYDLNADFVRSVAAALEKVGDRPPERRHPLAFCEQTDCSRCPYDLLCSATVRGLKEGKMLNRGRSGRGGFSKA